MLNPSGRIAVAVLAAGLLTAAASCSTKASDSSGGGGSAGGVKTGTGVTADTISVGQLTDLTGPFASAGKNLTQAEALYYDQINAAGGVCGRKINVVTKDTGYNVQNAVTQYQQMKDQVLGISQVIGSAQVAALQDQLTSDKMLTVPVSLTSSLLTNKQIMLVGTTYDYQQINLFDYALANNLIHKGDKVGYIYIDVDAGINGLAGAQYVAQKNGLTLVEKKVKGTDTDMTAQVTDLKSQGVKAIGITLAPTAAASAVGVDASTGLNVPILSTDGSFVPGLLQTSAGPALEKLFYFGSGARPISGTEPSTAKPVADYKAKYPDAVIDGSITVGYGVAKAFTEVLKKACDNKDLTRDGMNTAFRSVTNLDLGVIVPLDYSKPGAPPAQKVFISQPSVSQPAGLKPITDSPYLGADAAGYTPPGLK